MLWIPVGLEAKVNQITAKEITTGWLFFIYAINFIEFTGCLG